MKENLTVGVLAHVDAGKTTLSEALLYLSGKLKTLGRVDHRDSFLDTHALERRRGITIFAKQAILELPHTCVTLLDTPGHADLAAETERTLPVLDCAVLVVSGADGVQPHTETLWALLRRAGVPCLVFVSKMDLPTPGREALMAQLRRSFGEGCVDFTLPEEERQEQIALCCDSAMERYLEAGALTEAEIASLISRRALFPCFFGSGLHLEGVDALLEALDRYPEREPYGEEPAALVYKIARDAQSQRLTFVKVTGGELRVRAPLRYRDERGEEREEKISQIRLYSGLRYETADLAEPGRCCALLGLSATFPGGGLGAQRAAASPLLEPALGYRVLPPQGMDPALLLPLLQQLQEEDPKLHAQWVERGREIRVQLMGRMQTEILKSLVRERFGVEIGLDAGRVLYRETIADTVEGVGHYEPLRHYAEVHLILEPLPRGHGLVFCSSCSEDELDRNWQRLILTHLAEKRHLGVLTGSPITDMKITLAAGRAHLKHTEGGDFRQATYRAVRQGLMRAESILLEPWYAFTIELPPDLIGRAIGDVRAMGGVFEPPEDAGERLCLEGSAPAAALNKYQEELAAYSRGKGRLSLRPDGYRPCREQARVVADIGYDPQADVEETPDSVFCAHGAGFTVKWNEVPAYMHLESCLKKREETPSAEAVRRRSLSIDERELEAIMEREFGPIRRAQYSAPARNEAPAAEAPRPPRPETLIVDGYNVIFSWEELKTLARERLDLARERLMDLLTGYAAFTRSELVLVFDGFRTPGNPGSRTEYHNIHVAFTGDGETADAYIERLANEIGKNERVRVVTSDNLIRLSALRSGVLRSSSKEFEAEARDVLKQIEELLRRTNEGAHTMKLKDGRA